MALVEGATPFERRTLHGAIDGEPRMLADAAGGGEHLPRPVEPRQLGVGVRGPAPIRHDPGLRNRERRTERIAVADADTVRQLTRLTGELAALEVEGLNEQPALAGEEHVALRVDRSRLRIGNPPCVHRIERPDVDAPSLALGAIRPEQVSPAVGERVRKQAHAVGRIGGVRHGAAGSGHAHQVAGVGTEQDRAIQSPCPAARLGRGREHLWRAAADVDPLELSLRKESERPAVRRPEMRARVVAAFRPGDRGRVRGADRLQPDLRPMGTVLRLERDVAPVG